MKKYLIILVLFISSCTATKKVVRPIPKTLNRAAVIAQTLININGWNAWVHLPDDYDITAKTYPAIIFFPGTGEVGTNANLVIANGPGAYLAQGWDGNADTSKFLIFSLQPPKVWPPAATIDQQIAYIKKNYRVDANRIYQTGLSMGGWSSNMYVTTYNGIAAVVEVEGVKPDDGGNYPAKFDKFANQGGRLLGFEQKNDSRDILTRVNEMNKTRPGSGIFVPTNYGGGGHCCWEQFYGGKGVTPQNFLLDGVAQNIYQWMAKQKLTGQVSIPPVVTPPPINPPPIITPPPVVIAPPVTPPTGHKTSITMGGGTGIYYTNNGSILPGDTIKIIAGLYTSGISFSGLIGTASKPIVIINSGGQVVSAYGTYCFRIVNSQYFKFTGTGTTGLTYGFKAGGQPVKMGAGINFRENTRAWECDHVETQNTENGFICKIDPYKCLPESYSTGWVMDSIYIHDCYVHKTGGEGLYIINTASSVDVEDCNGNTITVEPVKGNYIRIINVRTDSTGWDGIQLAATTNAEIANCTVTNYGMINMGSQQAGILLGGKTSGSVHDNYVKGGTGNGLQIFGTALTSVYNNTVIDAGFDGTTVRQDAVIIDDRPQPGTKYSGLQFNFYNNKIINAGRLALHVYNSYGTIAKSNSIKNNTFIQPNNQFFSLATNLTIDSSGNKRFKNIADTGKIITPPVIIDHYYPQSIQELNSFKYRAGDSIFLKSGNVYEGTIDINQSGTSDKPIVITSYGQGKKPVLSGFKTLSNWTDKGQGIFETDANNVRIVSIAGKIQPIGRYPDTGYLSLESHVLNSSITDSQLTKTLKGDLVIKNRSYVMTVNPITSQNGQTINYTGKSTKEPMDGYGYFAQNDISYLDQFGEWYYDSTRKKLSVYFGANPQPVQANYLDTILSIRNVRDVIVKGIDFEGAGKRGVDVYNSKGVRIQNCKINLSSVGIFGAYTDSLFIYKDTITNSLTSGINLTNGCKNSTVRKNIIKNTGLWPGMGQDVYNGINLTAEYNSPSGSVVEFNEIDNSGMAGIRFTGDSITIQNNFINNYGLTKDDVGGISTGTTAQIQGEDSMLVYKDRKILNNVILNGIGAPQGTVRSAGLTYGILLDDNSTNVVVNGNTSAFNTNGIYLHNNKGITVKGNTFYGNYTQFMAAHDVHRYIREIDVKGNEMVNSKSGQYVSNFLTYADDIAYFGSVDSNYYLSKDTASIRSVIYARSPQQQIKYRGIKNWYNYSGYEKNGKLSPVDYLQTRFEYNPIEIPINLQLDKKYLDTKGQTYSGVITLQPYSSLVLIPLADSVIIPPKDTIPIPPKDTIPEDTVVVPIPRTIPLINWNDTTINYGSPVKPATSNVIGTFSYSPSINNLNPGVYNIVATFTPGDTTKYFYNFKSAQITVLKAPDPPPPVEPVASIAEAKSVNNIFSDVITWKASNESAVSYYSVEKTKDKGKTFTQISKVNVGGKYSVSNGRFILATKPQYRIVVYYKSGKTSIAATL